MRGLLYVGLIAASFTQVSVAQAQPAEEATSPAAAINTYTDAASFQNNGAYELALDEWSKFLKKYPKDPLASKAHYYQGACALQLKKYQQAATAYDTVIKNYAKFENREDAYLNLGWAQYQLAQTSPADQSAAKYAAPAATFAAMLKEFPSGKGAKADQALYFQAESLYAGGKRQEALAPYTQLMAKHPKSSLRADGLYALGVTHEELGQFAEAAPVYDAFLAEFPKHALATEIAMRKAETLAQAGLDAQKAGDKATASKQLAAAAAMFGTTAATPDFALADHAMHRQAFCQAKLSNFAASADLNAKLATSFPKSSYAKEATLEAARAYYSAGKFSESEAWFQKVLAADAANAAEAAHWLCRIYIRNNKPADAVALAAKTIPAAGESPWLVRLKMDEADALDRTAGKREDALAKYVAIATAHAGQPQAPEALYNAAFTALELKKYEEALQHTAAFEKAYAEHKLLPDVKFVAAECQIFLRQYDKAEASFAALTQNHATHPDLEAWRVRLGLAQYLQKKYAETIATLTPQLPEIKTPARNAEAQFLIGASQFYTGAFEAAVASLQASNAADAKWSQADETLLVLSRAQAKLDKNAEALATVKKMLADYPGSKLAVQAYYRQGDYSHATGDYKAAIAAYDASLAADAKSLFGPYAMWGKGWSQIKATDYAAAVKSFSTLIETHPDHTLAPDAYYARGLSRRSIKEYAAAITDLNAYLKSKPAIRDQSNALYERGLAEVALKKFEEAVATFNAILTADPEFPTTERVLYELAWAQKSNDADAKAVEVFARLAKDYPQSTMAAESHFHVAESLYQADKFGEAAAEYTAAKEKAPANGELGEKATYKLGWSHYQQKKYDVSLADFTAQVTSYPKGVLHSEGLFMKAESQYKLGQHKEALATFTTVRDAVAGAENISDSIKVLVHLHGGQSAAAVTDWKTSLDFLSPIPKEFPSSPLVAEANYGIGLAHHSQGDSAKALTFFEKSATTSRDKTGARARFMMGSLHFLNKKYDLAEKEFQRCLFGYGGAGALPDVKTWQEKSAYEIARMAETQIQAAPDAAKQQLIDKAVKNYTRVTEEFKIDPALTKAAAMRLEILAKLKA